MRSVCPPALPEPLQKTFITFHRSLIQMKADVSTRIPAQDHAGLPCETLVSGLMEALLSP